jgi:DNA-directed RNA polymerase subunit H (RpoH/RPB5)
MMKSEADAEGGGLLLSEEEKKQLMDAMSEVEKDLPKDDEDDQ